MAKTALMSVLVSLAMTMSASAEERPNVLFCFSDDWGRYAWSSPKKVGAYPVWYILNHKAANSKLINEHWQRYTKGGE